MKVWLDRRKACGNFRALQTHTSQVDFASNDYLGLARSSSLKEVVIQEWGKLQGVGSTGSRLLTGNRAYTEKLEGEIAAFHGSEAGLLFNCGFMANLGLITALAKTGATFLFDAEIHASMREGFKLSKSRAFPFRHQDLEHLEKRLKKCSASSDTYICVESVYSTDGSLSPLAEIGALAEAYGAQLIVDEAHAVGVFGPQGRGLAQQVFAQVIPFGKGVGAFGAIVLGSKELKDFLVNFATPFMYSTALPDHCLAAIQSSYQIFPHLEVERKHLKSLIEMAHFSPSTIQPIPISGNHQARKLSCYLASKGFDVRALLSPTVQRGKEVLRLCLHAFNSKEELTRLLSLVKAYHG
ncbi:MAG: pyridoxal phosphate-dependent aminotransferase family protein [Chlamydiia bacterium]|nr:pyridoxal phosphate-dependent aminotransferase family protein [Chlamydiia bacterium]